MNTDLAELTYGAKIEEEELLLKISFQEEIPEVNTPARRIEYMKRYFNVQLEYLYAVVMLLCVLNEKD